MAIIELVDVDTIYEGERIPAIRDINLKIEEGEFLAIVGPNGAGKSTLLETINGILEYTRGKVTIFGKDVKKFGSLIRKEIGYLFQNFEFDDLTPFLVEDVILMGRFGKIGLLKRPSPEDYKIVQEVMDFVGINGMENRPIGKLSGGQHQKVLLARILAKEPKILLLDEPFSNLDFKARVDISDKLCRLHKEKNLTILMVTHDMSFIPERCNRAVLMNGGRIIGDGTPEEILNRGFLKFAYEEAKGN